MAEGQNYTRSTFHSRYKNYSKPNSFSGHPRRPTQPRTSSTSSSDTACIVCYRDARYHSVGTCEHAVCFECSSRMRVLLEQNECPICRQRMDHVIFTNGVKSYAEVKDKIRMFIFIPKWHIYLEDEVIQRSFEELLEHKCSFCSEFPPFPNFEGLKEHMQRKHQLFSCDLCVEHIKHFSKERNFYIRPDLAYHKRKGDRNDTSHRGHPPCKFCDKRYFDEDELFKHLRKDHYFCHFCDADGYNHYYNTYDDLRIHYRKEHFLCEEENCAEEKFTSVFRTEIDLKAHLASAHSRLLGKHGTKQARTLEIEFAMPKRPENERGRFGRPHGGRGRDDETGDRRRDRERGRTGDDIGEVGTSATGERPNTIVQVPSIQPKMDSTVDFPTLGDGSSGSTEVTATTGNGGTLSSNNSSRGPANGSSLAQKMARASGMNVAARSTTTWKAGMQREEEFPVLGGGGSTTGPPVSQANTVSTATALRIMGSSSKTTPAQSRRNPEIDFPSLSGPSVTAASRINTKVWQGAGPGAKVKISGGGMQNQNGQLPKATKVAPCPIIGEQSAEDNGDFNFVPLSVSGRSTKVNAGKITTVDEEAKSEETESVAKKETSGKKGKKKEEKDQKDKVLALAAAALFNGGTAPTKTSHKQKIPAVEVDFPSLPIPAARNKGQQLKKTSKSAVPPPQRKISPPPGFQLKRSDVEVEEEEEEFQNVRKVNKPPPGFESVSPANKSCEVNFLDSVLQLGEISIPISGEYKLFLEPTDMRARNERLLEAIRSSLNGDQTTYESFLRLSTLFRKSEIPAQEYYDLCASMFGTLDFRVIFSELVVLLPDIQKQQELLVTHRNSGGQGEVLSTCHICHQVLKKGDLTFHMQAHASESDSFPALPSTTSTIRAVRQN